MLAVHQVPCWRAGRTLRVATRCMLAHHIERTWCMVGTDGNMGDAGAASLALALRELTGLTQLGLGGE